MYAAVVFDFFGVIRTDSFKRWMDTHEKYREDFMRLNRRSDRGEISVSELIAELAATVGQPVDEVLQEIEASTNIDYAVLEIAESLRKNYRVGLLSNASSSALRDLLRENDLERYFDEIVASGDVGLLKPQPEIFHHILEKMQVRPTEAIFIDDNPNNASGAEAIGMTGIVFTTARELRSKLQELGITL